MAETTIRSRAPYDDVEEKAHDKVDQEGVHETGTELDTPEYLEFVALNEKYQGDLLRKLTRRIDLHVIPILFVIYLLSYIDRANVGNARLFGVEADLGMSATDWNVGLSLLFITYALGGPPFTATLKIVGPKLALSGTFLAVACVVIGAGCCNNKAQWFALRLLLGLFEAGIYVGCAFVLTTWYTPNQLHSRLSWFYVAGTASGGVSGLLAFGLGSLDGQLGYRGWRWIYVVEGVISFVVALASYFLIQDAPQKANRWMSAEETQFIVLRNRYAYGGDKSGSNDAWSIRDYVSALKSWHVWVHSFSYFCFCTAAYGLTLTIPTIVANMGFSAARAQALSVPIYAVGCCAVVACGWYSDKYKHRMLACVIPACCGLIGLLICVTTSVYPNLTALTYIGVVLAGCGVFPLTPALSAWLALNVSGQTKRAAGLSTAVFCSQLGGVVGSNIYLANTRPRYPLGFGLSMGLLFVGNICLPIWYYFKVGKINAQREAMTEEEIRAKYGVDELTEMGDRSPYYRYER